MLLVPALLESPDEILQLSLVLNRFSHVFMRFDTPRDEFVEYDLTVKLVQPVYLIEAIPLELFVFVGLFHALLDTQSPLPGWMRILPFLFDTRDSGLRCQA